jgi:hypothetical protein
VRVLDIRMDACVHTRSSVMSDPPGKAGAV